MGLGYVCYVCGRYYGGVFARLDVMGSMWELTSLLFFFQTKNWIILAFVISPPPSQKAHFPNSFLHLIG